MKMVMTLTVSESGCLWFNKRPGAVIEPGTILARLDVDDPTRVTKAQPFSGKFPQHDDVPAVGEKVNQVFQAAKSNLEAVLNGYCLPAPFFQSTLEKNLERFLKSLRDPNLPLLELQEVIASVSGRIPSSVEQRIRKYMVQYSSNITSVMAQFPSQQIAAVIDG
jgi:acetyl-CoA carboxylase/biotin carboxylase 1